MLKFGEFTFKCWMGADGVPFMTLDYKGEGEGFEAIDLEGVRRLHSKLSQFIEDNSKDLI